MLSDCLILLCLPLVLAYTNIQFTISEINLNESEPQCGYEDPSKSDSPSVRLYNKTTTAPTYKTIPVNKPMDTVRNRTRNILSPLLGHGPPFKTDPIYKFREIVNEFLFGERDSGLDERVNMKFRGTVLRNVTMDNIPNDTLAHLPNGNTMRGEMFLNTIGAHLPRRELIHKGHCYLQVTRDNMQTALNAFAILLDGTIDDVLRLPQLYVLRSARSISMMKIEFEKLAATWVVVKGKRHPESITIDTLEHYRPLFKYLTAREMAQLNLTDHRILSYIGTHAELNRHQVGVIASKYIKMNPNWMQPRYLNIMNNLLCGVPMSYMRRIPDNTYLQLTHQVFYHIRACDPLQRRFYLGIMTRTQALGKSYSWSARDVSRLGLLLAVVEGYALSTINPRSMAGITAKVMVEIPAYKLVYITERQQRYLQPKARNIMARKLIAYNNQQRELHSSAHRMLVPSAMLFFTGLVNARFQIGIGILLK